MNLLKCQWWVFGWRGREGVASLNFGVGLPCFENETSIKGQARCHSVTSRQDALVLIRSLAKLVNYAVDRSRVIN